MLHGAQLDAAIRSLVSRPLRSQFFRAMLLKYAHDPLGKGRPLPANRFNLKNGARVLYLADTKQTADIEIQAFSWPARSTATIPVEIDLQAVIDLTKPAALTALNLALVELTSNFRAAPNPTATQELGERCAALGCVDGILFESLANPGHINLAVIEQNLSLLNSSIKVNDPANNLFDNLP